MLSPYFDDPSITTTTTWSSLEAVDPATWYTPAPSDPTLNNLDDHDHDHDNNNNNPFLFNNIIMGPTVTNFTTVPPPHPPHVPADFFSGFAAAASSSSSSSTTTNFSNLPLMTSTFESTFENRPKILRPLDLCPPVGAAPTLFQKRVARQQINPNTNLARFGIEERIIKKSGSEVEGGELVDHEVNGSFDGSGFDSDDQLLEEGNVKGKGGKKKGLPAKNLMAERRRRKKLNDRLYLLRSVVPKISKMDRASILGDAIEYLKELLQRINDLHNELESTPSSSSVPTPTASSFHPLTPTLPTLPSRIKEELCLSSLPSPNGQQPRVEVRVREGRAVNIHMFCARKPGLLLSAMKALDGLGLDIQQAVISCFNGFALDVFRAEQFKEGPGALPEEIKAVLLHSAGYQPAL